MNSASRDTKGKPKNDVSEKTVQYEDTSFSNMFFKSNTNEKLVLPVSSTIIVILINQKKADKSGLNKRQIQHGNFFVIFRKHNYN